MDTFGREVIVKNVFVLLAVWVNIKRKQFAPRNDPFFKGAQFSEMQTFSFKITENKFFDCKRKPETLSNISLFLRMKCILNVFSWIYWLFSESFKNSGVAGGYCGLQLDCDTCRTIGFEMYASRYRQNDRFVNGFFDGAWVEQQFQLQFISCCY